MEGRDLLALLHGGGPNLRTVRLTAATMTDRAAVSKAFDRWSRARSGASVQFARGRGPERPRYEEETTRLWIERPDRVREETDGELPRYGVRVGDTWWLWNDMQGAITNNGSPNHHAGLGEQHQLLLEPARLLPYFDFAILGEEAQAGRSAVRALARARPTQDQHRPLWPLPPGCEECELAVDLEHGTLLRLTAQFDGEPAVAVQIEEIAYNEPIPPETFEFVPPAGETVEDASRHHGAIRDEPIEEVVRRASFTVFIATQLDGPWRMRAMHLPQRRGQPHEHVHLHYHRDDATHSFGINQQPADAPLIFTAVVEPEELAHGGEKLQVVRPTDAFPLGSVRLAREGTSIEITSDNLPLEGLLTIVDSLEAAPRR